jgi:hypothetical protein
MKIGRLGFWLTTSAALAACSGSHSKAGDQDTDPGSTTGSSGTSGSSSGTSSGSTSKPKTDAGASGSSSDAGAHPKTDAGDAGPLQAFAVTLQNSGRHGTSLYFAVQGSDANAQTTEMQVQLQNAAGATVTAFDTDWDGVADSASTRLHFDTSTLGETNFTTSITLPGMVANVPSIAQAVVSLVDQSGNVGTPMTVMLDQQPIVMSGGACDIHEVANRCADGFVCSGTGDAGANATCETAPAPSLSQVAYYGGTNPAQIFLGNDPAEDLQTIVVAFEDSTGNSISVDLSGDGTIASSVSLNALTATGQAFYFEDNPVPSFTTQVPKISVTPIDSQGHSGTPVVAALSNQPVRSNGQMCDAYGVTACSTNSACSPGIVGAANTCSAVSSLQMTKCTAATAALTTGQLAGWGLVQGTSLWDPPAGCALASEVGHPETVLSLKLTQNVNTLTLSTAMPETDFDTILYVLPSCATSSATALGCNDDTQGYSSTLTLTNVAAGSYYVVVDSANSQAGHFGLSISTQ